ncbi:FecR domain-containing protein [Pontixanthobacter aestiaquae]|uniref:FecR protein domain-containing protein n=1 Tax=Pontixanthobacter aestiaquae TaxID=1509367 RepID=A0A844ZA99_9SPHN|nr:FecR domain-containing protein [Pontixanthobacter aestiaquae]MDN3645210.1 FecR domain-containing protein [Pontixanthobacter aestiaquae]MXO83790.1 hypothetical protein [Pontixanthobacter aestiaquae]
MAVLKTLSPRTLFLALAALCVAASPAASAPVRVGIAALVAGDVRISNATITKPTKIARRARLAWGDTLQTKGNSKLQILLLDRSTLTIGSKARLTIDRFVYDPGKSRTSTSTVTKGAFRFMSGRKTGNSKATINSPVGTIGIRGTALDGIVGKEAVKIAKDEPFLDGVKSDKKAATLVVLRGPGSNTGGGLTVGLADVTAAGKTVVLDQPTLAAYIPRPGAPPIGPFRLSAGGLTKLQEELSPRVTNANNGGLLEKIVPGVIAAGVGLLILTNGDDDDANPNNPTSSTPTNCDNPNNPAGVC